jgi:hypothetical protein
MALFAVTLAVPLLVLVKVGLRNITMNSKTVQKMIQDYDYGLDLENQILIYTGYYLHDDGKIYNYPEEL